MQTRQQQQSILKSIVLERAVVYARVSGDDRQKDGRNLDGQKEMGRDYATEKGYLIVEELAEDASGASGAEIDLPQLIRVREMARKGEFDILIVREIDRLSRNLAKQLIVEQELATAGVRIEYVLGEYPDSAEGRLQKHIKASIAEYEREKIKERMNRGKRRKVKAGSVNVAKTPPFGYKVVYDEKDNASLEIIGNEAETVRYIFELYLQGNSVYGIAKKLTGLGIPTPADLRNFGGAKKKSSFGHWSSSSVHNVLTNETYAGTWYFGKKKNEMRRRQDGSKQYVAIHNDKSTWDAVKVPPIVPPNVFQIAQEKLTENKKRRGKPSNEQYLLAKLCTCGECGYRLHVETRKHGYYRCPSHNRNYPRECSQKGFRQENVDAAVWTWLVSILKNEKSLELALESQAAELDRQRMPIKLQYEAAQVQIGILSEELHKILPLLKTLKPGSRAYAAILGDIDRLEDGLNKLEAQARQLKEKLDHELSPAKIQRIKEIARDVARGLDKAETSFKLRREIVEMLDIEVKLLREEGKQVAYVTCVLGEQELPILSSTFHNDLLGRFTISSTDCGGATSLSVLFFRKRPFILFGSVSSELKTPGVLGVVPPNFLLFN